jgi:signal transduction histidine kinase
MREFVHSSPFPGPKTAHRFVLLTSFLENLVKAKISLSKQLAISAVLLLFTFTVSWWMHDEFHLTPVLLSLVASILLSLFTDILVALSASLLSAVIADYLFIGPLGLITFDMHFFLRASVFLGTSFTVNFLVALLRRSYLSSTAATQAAERANREKDEILAILSHDLRAPLTAANLSLQMIERILPGSELENSIHRYASRAREACKRVNSLVLDLLDSAQIQNHGLAVHRELNDLGALLYSLGSELNILAAQGGIGLDFPGAETKLPLSFDLNRISQLITNLVSNALKFTPKGGRVSIRLEALPHAARISVSDTGTGMNQAQVNHVFERFWQADRSNRSGVGLGLYIVKAIVDAHVGKISVDSSPGKGTTFTVELPLSLQES